MNIWYLVSVLQDFPDFIPDLHIISVYPTRDDAGKVKSDIFGKRQETGLRYYHTYLVWFQGHRAVAKATHMPPSFRGKLHAYLPTHRLHGEMKLTWPDIQPA